MKNYNKKQVKYLERLKASAFLVAVLSITILFVFSFSLVRKSALATVPNPAKFAKVAGNTLTLAEWNELTLDFVDQNGDTLGGDLNMNSHRVTDLLNPPVANTDAATKQYVDDEVAAATAGAIEDVDGLPMKMVCGATVPGVGWANDGSGNVRINIDTRSTAGVPNFSAIPYYITSIGGDDLHDQYTGAMAIYLPTTNGFRIYASGASAAIAAANNWYVSWCGFGN